MNGGATVSEECP